jgi:hypothetical protein
VFERVPGREAPAPGRLSGAEKSRPARCRVLVEGAAEFAAEVRHHCLDERGEQERGGVPRAGNAGQARRDAGSGSARVSVGSTWLRR